MKQIIGALSLWALFCCNAFAGTLTDVVVTERSRGIERHLDDGEVWLSPDSGYVTLQCGVSSDTSAFLVEDSVGWIRVVASKVLAGELKAVLLVSENASQQSRQAEVIVDSIRFSMWQHPLYQAAEEPFVNPDATLYVTEDSVSVERRQRHIVDSRAHSLIISDGSNDETISIEENEGEYPRLFTVTVGTSSIDIIQQCDSSVTIGNFLQTVIAKTHFDTGLHPEVTHTYEIKGYTSTTDANFFSATASKTNGDKISLNLSAYAANWSFGQDQTNSANEERYVQSSQITSFWAQCSNQGLILKNKKTVSKQLFDVQRTTPFVSTNTIYLFDANRSPALGSQLYYFKVYDGAELIHYYLPAESPDSVACLYDLVTHTYLKPRSGQCVLERHESIFNGLITIVEDDGRARLIDDGICALYETYGILPTLAINPGQIKVGTPEEQAQRNFFTHSNGSVFPIFSLNELQELHAKGYDVQDHSWSHADFRYVWFTDDSVYTINGRQAVPAGPSWWLDAELRKTVPYNYGGPWNKYASSSSAANIVSDATIWNNCKLGVAAELEMSKQWLKDYLNIDYNDVLITPSDNASFASQAYAAGFSHQTTGNSASISVNTAFYNTTIQNRGSEIKGITRFYLKDTNINELLTAIDVAVANNYWIVLLIHSVSPAQKNAMTAAQAGQTYNLHYGTPYTQTYGTSLTDATGQSVSYGTYERLLKKIKSSGIKYATFHDAVTKYELER